MIKYSLICGDGHEFDGWYPNIESFDKLKKSGKLMCGVCDSHDVMKRPMAPNVATARRGSAPVITRENLVEAQLKVRDFVEKNTEDVGSAFPKEASAMHQGKIKERPIRGTGTPKQIERLEAEGVPFTILPSPKLDS